MLVEGWHDLDNKDYDCWPLEKPDEYNMLDCGGEWVLKPLEKDNLLLGEWLKTQNLSTQNNTELTTNVMHGVKHLNQWQPLFLEKQVKENGQKILQSNYLSNIHWFQKEK